MIRLQRPAGAWNLLQPFEKLVLRGQLPGAFGYDRAAHSLRVMRASSAFIRSIAGSHAPAAMCRRMSASLALRSAGASSRALR